MAIYNTIHTIFFAYPRDAAADLLHQTRVQKYKINLICPEFEMKSFKNTKVK